jgi:glycosyltransferase involved in cell wall biosynthesis
MNLLFVIDNLGSGGAQRQMVNLSRSLVTRGHHVEFFTYYPSDHYRSLLDEAGIKVHLHQKTSRFSPAPLSALRDLIQQRRFDIILSFLDTPNFYAEIARIGHGETKLVVSERFMYPPGKLPMGLRLLQQCHRLADAITVNSHHQRVRMIQEFPWMERNIRTIYNGFDLDTFHPTPIVSRGEETLRLLAISSVAYKKNSLNLAKALFISREKYKVDVHIDWIGTHQISGEGTRVVEQTTDYLKSTAMIKYWNWLGERHDIPQMLSSHDALIHPSFFEGLPNVVCEALACGRPTLASNVCDHPMLVQDGVTGYLFDPNSAEDIARSIHAFSSLPASSRAEMGKKARLFAEANLSLNRYVQAYEDLFVSLAARQKGALA